MHGDLLSLGILIIEYDSQIKRFTQNPEKIVIKEDADNANLWEIHGSYQKGFELNNERKNATSPI